MSLPSKYLENCIHELSKLPGIGTKSASRIAFFLLKTPKTAVDALVSAINQLKDNIRYCEVCGGISDDALCSVCADVERDRTTLCVVEEPEDMLSIEKSGAFNGLYHVLGGVISPLDGVGPEELSINKLVERCKSGIKEVIIATNPTIEGDATALYIASLLKPLNIKVMRIAHGLPVGSDLEFVDASTLAKSISGRREM
ncbi:MAG: recombination mediator RecR [Spirochaetes bacterium]|nr:recombination mediator RecR [Spirochaetota bacterium]